MDRRRTVTRRKRRTDTSSRKRLGTLNLVLIMVGVFFLWFNWQMLDIFRAQGAIPETYACAVIAATLGECGICGWIRTTKDRKEKLREQAQKGRTGLSESENAMYDPQGEENLQDESEVEFYE